MTKKCSILFSSILLCVFVLTGCSSTKDMELEKSNLQRQMTIQRHLQSLNKQNERLKKSLTESSALSSDNGELLNKALMKDDNSPALDQLLNDYKQVNQKTQLTLDSITRTIEDDSKKNAHLLEILDGFSPLDSEQENRLDELENALGAKKKNNRYAKTDHVHIGISPQQMLGSATFINKDNNSDNTFQFSGTTSGVYFTYAGDNDAAAGFRYMTFNGTLEPDQDLPATGIDHFEVDAYLGMVSLGFRIYAFNTFNIIPEVVYGAGETVYNDCTKNSCDKNNYYKINTRAFGIEVPFYHQLSVAFSWGFKLTGYKVISDKADRVEDSTETSHDLKTEATYTGLGVMAGLAW